MSAVLILNESSEAYHSNACLSNSKIGTYLDKGPYYFHGRHVAKTIPSPEFTDALRLGVAFDTLLTVSLEQYANDYVIKPEGMSFTTKEGKAWRDAHCQDKSKLITWDEHQMFLLMQKAAHENDIFSTVIHERVISQATVRMDKTNWLFGIQSKPDWLSMEPCEFSRGLKYSVNLKTTADFGDWFNDCDLESIKNGSPVYNYCYHRQAALDQFIMFNCEEIGETAHFLFVIEKQEPYRTAFVALSDAYLEAGWKEAKAAFDKINTHYESGHWPKTIGGIRRLDPPRWLVDKAERLELAAP